MSVVSVVCCSGRGVCVGPVTRPVESTECGVSECDGEDPIMRRSWLTMGCFSMGRGGGIVSGVTDRN